MSARSEIQDRLAELCIELELNEVYGVLRGSQPGSHGRPVRTVNFCRARTLDGFIQIYGPKFILVSSNRTPNTVCRSLAEAETYIKDTFA